MVKSHGTDSESIDYRYMPLYRLFILPSERFSPQQELRFAILLPFSATGDVRYLPNVSKKDTVSIVVLPNTLSGTVSSDLPDAHRSKTQPHAFRTW